MKSINVSMIVFILSLFLLFSKEVYSAPTCSVSSTCQVSGSMKSCNGGPNSGEDCSGDPLLCAPAECKSYPWCDTGNTTNPSCNAANQCAASCPAGYCSASCNCNPNCSDSANYCTSYPNGCGGSCTGTKTPNCSDGANQCSPYPDGCGGTCTNNLSPSCSLGSCPNSCGNSQKPILSETCGGCAGVDRSCTCVECTSCSPECGQNKAWCGGQCSTTQCGGPNAPSSINPNNSSANPYITSNNSITLSWTDPATMTDLNQYIVKVDGTQVGTNLDPTVHSLVYSPVGGLNLNQKYNWSVGGYKSQNCTGVPNTNCGGLVSNGVGATLTGYFCYQLTPGSPTLANANGADASNPYAFAGVTTANL